MHHHHEAFATDARDRRDIAKEIEAELIIERGIDRVRRTDQEERVAIRGCPHHHFGANVAASATAGFRLGIAGPAFPTAIDPSGARRCRATARGKANDQAHRPRWIGLRPSEARHGGSAAAPLPDARIVRRGSFMAALLLNAERWRRCAEL